MTIQFLFDVDDRRVFVSHRNTCQRIKHTLNISCVNVQYTSLKNIRLLPYFGLRKSPYAKFAKKSYIFQEGERSLIGVKGWKKKILENRRICGLDGFACVRGRKATTQVLPHSADVKSATTRVGYFRLPFMKVVDR